jgi:hypothetical protein
VWAGGGGIEMKVDPSASGWEEVSHKYQGSGGSLEV